MGTSIRLLVATNTLSAAGTRYTLVFSVILVVGYVIKDRIKEWGKR